MDEDKILREHLIGLLKEQNAHVMFEQAVKDFPISKINIHPQDLPYSAWQLLDHIRIAQYDILDFIRNPNYKHLNWPKDYWPANSKKATKGDWNKSIAMFRRDSEELEKIIANPKTNLYAKIPHGTGQTVLREALLVADHNAYHTGEFIVLRRLLDAWDKS